MRGRERTFIYHRTFPHSEHYISDAFGLIMDLYYIQYRLEYLRNMGKPHMSLYYSSLAVLLSLSFPSASACIVNDFVPSLAYAHLRCQNCKFTISFVCKVFARTFLFVLFFWHLIIHSFVL